MGLLLVLLSHGKAASWTMLLRSLTELRGTVGGCSKLTTFLRYLLSDTGQLLLFQAAVLLFMGLLRYLGTNYDVMVKLLFRTK